MKTLKENLTKEEYKAIRSLKQNYEIIIKPADKGNAIVIMDKAAYINEGQKILNNTQFYEPTDADLTEEVIHRVSLHVHNMLLKGQISQSICSYLTTDIDRTQQFYMLPKVHNDKKKSTRKSYSLREWRSLREDFTICELFHRILSAPFPTIHKQLCPFNQYTQYTGLITTDIDRTQQFYMLPKVHNDKKKSTRKSYSLREWRSLREDFTICELFHRILSAPFPTIHKQLCPFNQYTQSTQCTTRDAIMHFGCNKSLY